ncbi:family 78 glycoside hydrolase catalytic domain [Occultella gossypii]|uniref:alpha-L-rhamnosidase n=1 Tax=Occultella gossypii TaxID=2800820 RepID=A0ABS7SD67_9MICO|nr:family 78 glycoside hydrolase catalytic domain [Occultella gossypii]MBZ2198301.1 family 78 glycoside hydrolase catalytic domain [Occultella gossypii]
MSADSPDRPSGLMVDLQSEPVGVDVADARFSWLVPALGDGMQVRYRIQVAASPSSFGTPFWDSGPVTSASSTAVPYTGPRLSASTPYWWRVRADTSVAGDWATPSRLITAADSWGGAAIWGPAVVEDSGVENSWVLLRYEFDLPDSPALVAFVEAAGRSPEGGQTSQTGPRGGRQYVYKLWANGRVAGRGSVRASDTRARYHTHDLSGALRPGRNALAALCWAEHGRQFIARLVVVLADGHRVEIPTSTRWKAASGARLLPGTADIGGGWYRAPREDWDLRHEPVGWTEPGFDDRDWAPALACEAPPDPAPATVSIEQSLGEVAEAARQTDGRWFIDLGREIVGGIRLDVDGTSGARVHVRVGEELEHGRVRFRMRTHNVYEDIWTLRDGPQSVEHWGYRAFRYIELEADPALDLTHAVRPLVLRSPYVGGAAFTSSDPDLDRVWELCRYTIEATSLDLYVDTPARERGAYEGDAYVNQLSQYAVERSYALARYSGEYLTRRPTWPSEYHLMPVLMAWEDYLATGDDRQFRTDFEHWEGLNYDRFLGEHGLLRKDPGPAAGGWDADLVDWPATYRDGYEFTEVNTVLNAFQAAAYAALARIAEVVDRPRDAAHYRDLADRMRAALNSLLLDASAYRDGLGSTHHAQHATAFPVALGLAPADRLTGLGDWLRHGGIRMSVYGSQFLLEALCKAGRSDHALALMSAAGPNSWLHLIDGLGATIVPEAWDPSLKPNMTYSHAWGSAPVNVVARWILGVRSESPGAARVVIEPRPGPLSRMSGTVPTIRGAVTVDYDRTRGTLHVATPPNTTGHLIVHRAELGLAEPVTVEAPAGSAVARTPERIEITDAPVGDVNIRWGDRDA